MSQCHGERHPQATLSLWDLFVPVPPALIALHGDRFDEWLDIGEYG